MEKLTGETNTFASRRLTLKYTESTYLTIILIAVTHIPYEV